MLGRNQVIKGQSLTRLKLFATEPKRVLKADLILLAMGFLGPEDYFSGSLPIEREARSNIKTENKSYETNVKGFFVAGDARRGQILVV